MARLYPLKLKNCNWQLGKPTDGDLRSSLDPDTSLPSIITKQCVLCGESFTYVPRGDLNTKVKPPTQWQYGMSTHSRNRKHCNTCLGNHRRLGPRAYQQATERQILDAAYQWIRENVACVDCRWLPPKGVLEFDHLPQYEKVMTLSRAYKKGNVGVFVDELEKCEAVCVVCHRVRTEGRRNGGPAGRWAESEESP